MLHPTALDGLFHGLSGQWLHEPTSRFAGWATGGFPDPGTIQRRDGPGQGSVWPVVRAGPQNKMFIEWHDDSRMIFIFEAAHRRLSWHVCLPGSG